MTAQLGADGQPGARIERRQRLVEEQQRRVPHQRPGQRRPLGLPAGQLAGPAIGESGQADAGQPAGCRLGPGRPAFPPGAEPELHVLPDGQVGEQRTVLRDVADAPTMRFWSFSSELDYAAAAPYALVLVVLAIPVTLVLFRQSTKVAAL